MVSPAPNSAGDALLAIAEVRALEVRYLAELPVPFTMLVRDPELGSVLVSTSRRRVQEARAARALVWAPLGLEVAAFAIQEGRAGAREWRWWCREVLSDPTWRLEPARALGGGKHGDVDGRALVDRLAVARRARPITEPTITVGRFLDVVGAELVGVTFEEDQA